MRDDVKEKKKKTRTENKQSTRERGENESYGCNAITRYVVSFVLQLHEQCAPTTILFVFFFPLSEKTVIGRLTE